ncbi:MAG TPA: NADH-quinone oxidoreductase subunit J [Planctomycetota bacterium]|nr:NADH-quinone oxidoreductase subunit J [Planctomycetota bacterium]
MSKARSRIAAALLAILLAGACWVGARFAGEQGAAFGMFAWLSVGGALVCLFERSLVRSCFALLVTLLSSAGLFLLLDSDFLALMQVLVGAGGVLALLLFGAMLAPPDPTERSLARILVALLLLAPLCGLVAWRCGGVSAFRRPMVAAKASSQPGIAIAYSPSRPRRDAGRIGVALVDPNRYAVAFEVAGLLLVVALVAAHSISQRREDAS